MPTPISPALDFSRQMLDCVVGGLSALDIAHLNVQTREEAYEFTRAYGYDLEDAEQREQLWSTHRRAVALIKEQLLEEGESIPERLFDPKQLTDLSELLIVASSRRPEDREAQRWACAILRVMHVDVHLRNDLFSAFRDEIQTQILKPLQDSIQLPKVSGLADGSGDDKSDQKSDEAGSVILGPAMSDGGIRLTKFEIKPFKTTASSVIKLLARPEKVALTLLDKLGVRFVTSSVHDAFRVIRFLVDNHLLSYPHIIPSESNNTLYPVNLFIETMNEIKTKESKGETVQADEIQKMLRDRLATEKARAEYREKGNVFSGADYRFIKFINRRLITVSLGATGAQRPFRFFYPYEIQVMDQETYERNLSGPMAHDAYKDRQRRRARERVLKPPGDHRD